MNVLRIGIVFAGLALIGTAAAVFGAMHWDAATKAMHNRLEAARLPLRSTTVDFKELEGLPAPVQKYFRTVLREGQPMIAAVDVRHSGQFNVAGQGEHWSRFTSTQRVVVYRPGFDWDASIAMLPGVAVRVRDAYVAGNGILRAAVFGWMKVAEMEGGTAIAEGELMRFVAEAAWYPTVLLPSQGIHWEPVDGSSARATFEDGNVRVTLTFAFRPDGTISSVHAAARGRTIKDQTIPTPWTGRYWNYVSRGGMLVPLEGEVGWQLPEGDLPYWRARIEQISYQFAR